MNIAIKLALEELEQSVFSTLETKSWVDTFFCIAAYVFVFVFVAFFFLYPLVFLIKLLFT